jgi:hypothetical protein
MGVSRLSPFGLLIVLWWLFVMTPPQEATLGVPMLALWYATARNMWRKDSAALLQARAWRECWAPEVG